jgi:hypothetical protein
VAVALRGAAADAAARALRRWAPAHRSDDDPGLGRPGEPALAAGATLALAAACAARLRLDAVRAGERAHLAEAGALAEAAVVATRRTGLRGAALRRAVVERLEATWRRARAVEAARRAEAALDDRPWARPADVAGRPISACRRGAGRPAPGRTGP